MKEDYGQEIIKSGSAENDKNTDDILSDKKNLTFRNTELKFEPYGAGDYRLLRFLPNNTCLFEEIPNEENRNISNLNQYTQILFSANEKLNKEENKNIFIKNEEEWNRIEECRQQVEKDLKEFMILFDLALGSLNNDKDRNYMELCDCLFHKDIKENKQNLSIAVTSREKTIENLKKYCEKIRQEMHSINGVVVHKYYLCLLNQLIPHWKLLTKKYAEIDYMQNDNNFPYVSEVIIEYFSLPSLFWKCSSTPIFLSWPPFPSFSPFKSQYAQLNFSVNELTNWEEKTICKDKLTLGNEEDLDNWESKKIGKFYKERVKKEEFHLFKILDKESTVFIRFEGTPAHLIEKEYTIRFELIPLNVPVRKNPVSFMKKEKSKEKQKGTKHVQTTESKDKNEKEKKRDKIEEERKKIGKTFPDVTIPYSIFFKQAQKVHTILTKAQWILIDKSIFCIFAEQINNFKDKNNEITIHLKKTHNKKYKKVKIHCTQISHQSIEFLIPNISLPSKSGKIMSVDFSFAMLHDSLKNFEQRDKQENVYNTFEYCKNGKEEREKKKKNQIGGEAQKEKEKAIDNDLIEMFLNLAFAKIRDLFICAWKHFSLESPLTGADIVPNMFQHIFDDYNMQPLALNFLCWFVESLYRYIKIR